MFLPSTAGDRVLSILDCAARPAPAAGGRRQRRVSLNQLLTAAIVGSIQELVDQAAKDVGDNGR